jgi:hypothetical protein
MIRPPRGPRSVLWVVVVTNSQWGTGLVVQAGHHEARDVGDVGEQQRADLIGDGRNAAKSSPRG